MRLSMDSEDPGYELCRQYRSEGRKISIFLNGQEIKGVDLADDELGVVRACVPDAEGKPQVDPSNPDQVWVQTHHGDVRIEIGEPGSSDR